jgi:pilus assembly protein CpaC
MVEPTDGTRPASTADYFLNNTDEVDASAPKRPVALADGSAIRPVAATTSGHFLDLPKD